MSKAWYEGKAEALQAGEPSHANAIKPQRKIAQEDTAAGPSTADSEKASTDDSGSVTATEVSSSRKSEAAQVDTPTGAINLGSQSAPDTPSGADYLEEPVGEAEVVSH